MYINTEVTTIVVILVGEQKEVEQVVQENIGTSKGPRMLFSDRKELLHYLQEWKQRLFLSDWIVDAELCDVVKDDKDNDCWGLSNIEFSGRTANILIKRPTDIDFKKVRKYCAEQTLVHELLHLKYNVIAGPDSYESTYVDLMQHQELDRMADSLIMAKYNIPFEFFINKKASKC